MKERREWLKSGVGLQDPKEVSIHCSASSSATDGEARTFNGSIELCRADSDSSQKVGSWESQGVARERAQLACGSSVESCWEHPPGLSVPANSPPLSISAGSEWKSVEVTPGGEMGILW